MYYNFSLNDINGTLITTRVARNSYIVEGNYNIDVMLLLAMFCWVIIN